MKKLLSWNVNGIRAAEKKGFASWLASERPYLLGVQETKARPEQLSCALLDPPGYFTYWSAAEKAGYSGTAVFAAQKPESVRYGFGVREFDREGRTILLEYPDFYFLNIYFPNGGADLKRLDYKLAFYAEFLGFAGKLKKSGKTVIVCGDVNTAHRDIDLARPRQNETHTGFLPQERAWLDRFTLEFADTFRLFHREGGHYSWWDLKTGARARNTGWRLDYFYVDRESAARVEDAYIMPEVTGSDHCPVALILK
ncbi:MAG: exodeoxyribonuclease III [Elusimicrobiaceae bacterium]|nr:exodeoxyribonuclease III [Elusimicrobiaceae bacterium]